MSRIEHEYVLQTLRESLPALSAVSVGYALSIPQKAYMISGNRICVQPDVFVPDTSSTVRFFFKHKLRGFYFDAPVVVDDGGALSFEIAREIFKDDRDSSSEGQGSLDVTFDVADCHSSTLSAFPLDSILVDPDVLSGKLPRLQVLAERCGVAPEDILFAFRLYEYLEALSAGDVSVPEPMFGHLLFIDHRHALTCVALNSDTAAKYLHTEQRIDIRVDSRRIRTVASICGCLRLNAGLTALCFDIASIAPEDKRFLFEKLYREKYRGG